MLLKEIIDIRNKFQPFNVDLPLVSPKLTIPFSPSLVQLFKNLTASIYKENAL